MPRTSRSQSGSQLRPESERNTKGKTLIIAVALIALVANTFVLLCSYDVSFRALIGTLESSETSQLVENLAADDKTNHRLLNAPSTEGAELRKLDDNHDSNSSNRTNSSFGDNNKTRTSRSNSSFGDNNKTKTSRSKSPRDSQLRPESSALIGAMESSETSKLVKNFAAADKTNHRLLNTPSTEGAEISKATKAPLAATEVGIQEDISSSSKTMENTTDATKKKSSMMVIASYPKSSREYAAMWSQLECLGEKFDQIIIAADHQFKNTVDGFVNEVKDTFPKVGSKLKAQYHINNRYDAGLWCDVLLQENIVKEGKKEVAVTTEEPLEVKNVSSPQTLHSFVSKNASSAFDRFVLINDSMMALEKSNELLESLEANKNTTFVSLNYWSEKNITEGISHYWLESPARAFNLEGVEVFANYVCTLPQINKKNVLHECPNLKGKKISKVEKVKRCIVQKTEIELVNQYPSWDNVHGLYRGHDQNKKHWSVNYTFWTTLRDEKSFPFVKVRMLDRMLSDGRSHEVDRCTKKMNSSKWKIF